MDCKSIIPRFKSGCRLKRTESQERSLFLAFSFGEKARALARTIAALALIAATPGCLMCHAVAKLERMPLRELGPSLRAQRVSVGVDARGRPVPWIEAEDEDGAL